MVYIVNTPTWEDRVLTAWRGSVQKSDPSSLHASVSLKWMGSRAHYMHEGLPSAANVMSPTSSSQTSPRALTGLQKAPHRTGWQQGAPVMMCMKRAYEFMSRTYMMARQEPWRFPDLCPPPTRTNRHKDGELTLRDLLQAQDVLRRHHRAG